MTISSCCSAEMHKVDQSQIPYGFEKTSHRNPIGQILDFYTCTTCQVKWRRVEQTHHPYAVTWNEVS